MEKWNPLEIINMNAGEDSYRQLAINSTKQQIKNILKSYVGYFDPFCELLQNAMDATDKREENDNTSSYCKKIKIIIDISENSLYVADNGIGFEEDQFRAFLSPNVSYKNNGHTRGNKGVGTTYLAYGFNKMEVYTKTSSFTQYVVINNARNWIDDKTGSIDMPFVEVVEGNDSTTLDGSKSNVIYDIYVINTNKQETSLINQEATYYYPHLFFKNSSVNISEVIAWQKSEIDKGRDGAKSIVFRYIMTYYNRQRIYIANPGGLPPAMYRQAARCLAA